MPIQTKIQVTSTSVSRIYKVLSHILIWQIIRSNLIGWTTSPPSPLGRQQGVSWGRWTPWLIGWSRGWCSPSPAPESVEWVEQACHPVIEFHLCCGAALPASTVWPRFTRQRLWHQACQHRAGAPASWWQVSGHCWSTGCFCGWPEPCLIEPPWSPFRCHCHWHHCSLCSAIAVWLVGAGCDMLPPPPPGPEEVLYLLGHELLPPISPEPCLGWRKSLCQCQMISLVIRLETALFSHPR